jgi:hypothetical protein
MRFVFPMVGLAFIALLFVNFYPPLRSSLRVGTSESGLPKLSGPTPLQVLTATPVPKRDMTSPPVLAPAAETKPALEPQAAREVPAKVEPGAESSRNAVAKVGSAARAARAEVPPKNKRVTRSRGYKQTPSFPTFSIKGY